MPNALLLMASITASAVAAGAPASMPSTAAIGAYPEAPPTSSAAPVHPGALPQAVEVRFADRDLAIDRPAGWTESNIRGGGIQVNLVGGPSGFPHFTVQSDVGAGLPARVSPAAERESIEELFRVLTHSVGGTEVLEAGWKGINGLRVHDSLSVRPSAAGPLKVRRLLFLHAGIPYVLSWGAPLDEYEQIAAQVARRAGSLRYTD